MGGSWKMNHSMTIESTEQSIRVKKRPVLRSRETPIAITHSQEIASAAMARFRACHNFEVGRLQCEVRDGTLIIYGQVSSYYLKQLAQETVRPAAGAYRIVNRVEVVYASE
jgi:uncharacterized membrane protein